MKHWWESAAPPEPEPERPKAVAYYRHSAQDRQENSIPIQQDQVREWAEKHGFEIIQEYADAGKSGLNAEGRPAFTEMMEESVKKRDDFEYILCLDVSRWGRFQDIDLSALLSAECKKHGKEVVYTSMGLPGENDPFRPVYVQFERFRAAHYSKELSDKVWRGCVKIAEQGYWAGGSPPYGLHRLLLDEAREPVRVLEPGQHKAIQNQRVTLVEGPATEVAVIRRIFHEFVEMRHSEYKIAEGLNRDGILSPAGHRWGAGTVLSRLRNEKYAGTMVYNQTSQKLKTPTRQNPPEDWVRTEGAFEGIVSYEQFTEAQKILDQRRRKYDPARMLSQLDGLYQEHGMFHSTLLRCNEEIPKAGTYAREFGSLDFAFQQLFNDQRDRARQTVQQRICEQVPEVLSYTDFLVLNQKMAISVQPAVPIPRGYTSYWPFRPDDRPVIDLTLGVLLSEPQDPEILGYVAMPRWFGGSRTFRFSSRSARVDLFGRASLDFLKQLV